MRRLLEPLARRWRELRQDRRGVSAVEFALVAPILILMFFGLTELAQAMTADRRLAHAASAIGDLVAQDTSVSSSDLTDVFSAASTILAPYPTTTLSLRVSSITGDASGNPKVVWSKAQGTGMSKLTAGSTATLPTGLVTTAGDNVIMSEATYTYTPLIGYVIKSSKNFTEKFYLRPRQVTAVPCADC